MDFRRHEGRLANVRKIAVVRANALGDLVFVLPALAALRAAYPAAEIVLLGQEWHAGFLAGRPGPVDRVVPIPACPGVSRQPWEDADEPGLRRFFSAMRAERFDLAVQLHGGGGYSNPFVRRLGATTSVGLRTPDAPPLDRSVPYVYYQHEVLRYLEVVSLVGARTPEIEPRLAVTEADLDASREVVPEEGVPLVALHPGASDRRRRWPAARFAAVGDALARAGARVAITGTEPERALVEEVAGAMREHALALPGRLALGALTGLLARSAVVVSNDTGPLHLAAAVGTATVGIYWCGNLINAMPLSRLDHRPAVSWTTHCPVCGIDCATDAATAWGDATRCEHDPSFVTDVSTDEVRESALALLAARDASDAVPVRGGSEGEKLAKVGA